MLANFTKPPSQGFLRCDQTTKTPSVLCLASRHFEASRCTIKTPPVFRRVYEIVESLWRDEHQLDGVSNNNAPSRETIVDTDAAAGAYGEVIRSDQIPLAASNLLTDTHC